MQLEAGTMQLQAVVADNTRLQHEVSRLQKVPPHPFLMALLHDILIDALGSDITLQSIRRGMATESGELKMLKYCTAGDPSA